MAPPGSGSRNPPSSGTPLISAFFKPRTTNAQPDPHPDATPPSPSSLLQRKRHAKAAPSSDAIDLTSGDEATPKQPRRKQPKVAAAAFPSASASSSRAPALPTPATPRPTPTNTVSRKEKVASWRFNPSESEGEAEQRSSQPRCQAEQKRHEAFRRRLLGPDNPLAKRGSRGAAGALDDEEVAAAVASPMDVDGDDQAAKGGPDEDDAEPSTSANAFSQYAHQSGAASSKGAGTSSSAGKAKGRQTAKGKGKAAAELGPSGQTWTPLEQQILELKEQHPGVLLIIEVGYKLRFFGEDARVASRELNVMCFPDRNFLTAMIPVHRLHVHVKKLIAKGHKVGVVRQTETRALKAASGNASKPFVRKLTALYTASTWVDDIEQGDDGAAGDGRSLVALVERLEGGSGADERVAIGLVAVSCATGTLTYDQFSDGNMRSELETRMGHLQPAELLLPPTLSRQTEKLLRYLAGSSATSGAYGERIRIERSEAPSSYSSAASKVTSFYNSLKETTEEERGRILATIHDLPHLSLQALALAIDHLKSFGLESIFSAASNFQSFAGRTEMMLQGTTLENLEIFRNSTTFQEKGSLIWLLAGHCKTAMGRRLLRRWVGRPLTDVDKLRDRCDAVQALVEKPLGMLAELPSMLKLPDLEKGMARLSYGRATPSELATILLSLNTLVHLFDPIDNASELRLGSEVLNEAVAALPRSRKVVKEGLQAISLQAARDGKVEDLFTDPDRYPAVQEAKDNIAIVDSELHEHLKELRKLLKQPKLAWATVSGLEHLVEVRAADAKKVPADWLRISATQKFVRFHTPTVMTLQKRRNQWLETLVAEAQSAFLSFCRQICDDHFTAIRGTINAIGTLDALFSLAKLGATPGYNKPSFTPGSDRIELKGFRHPMSEALREGVDYVENDVELGGRGGEDRGIILTGANMGGKSSTVRAIALVTIMAQIGSYVPCTSGCTLDVHDAVLTRMGASDELAKGRSTFMVELSETSQILSSATSRSLVILDELGRGTSTNDGQAIAGACLQHLMEREESRRPKVLFVTHYFSLARSLAGRERGLGLRAMHMGFVERDKERQSGTVGSTKKPEQHAKPQPKSKSQMDVDEFEAMLDAEDAKRDAAALEVSEAMRELERGDGDKEMRKDRSEEGDGDRAPGHLEIVFLYKLRPGIAAKSFGIHCGALAGLPRGLLRIAEEKSKALELDTERRMRGARMRRMERLVGTLVGEVRRLGRGGEGEEDEDGERQVLEKVKRLSEMLEWPCSAG